MNGDTVIKEQASAITESDAPMVVVRNLWKIFGGNPAAIPAALAKMP